jgi:hypothetical protein
VAHRSTWLTRLILLLLVMLATAGSARHASAQVDQGTINGIIEDSQHHVIRGATVTLTNKDTNLVLTRKTTGSGEFTFNPIKIGNYSLSATASGFQTVLRENLNLNVSQVLAVNLELSPGNVSETVTVTSAPVLQTEEVSTGQVFTQRQIDAIPLDGRNYVFIAQLTTGVAAPNQGFSQVAKGGDFTSNGSRVSQNNFVLDGVDNNSNMQDFLNGATYAVRPPPDALAEFKVESSNYSAELGRSTGAAINASIKSGTNAIHGSLWEYLENDRLNAADYFNRKGKTHFHQNTFGATLGGPIWKNKIFVFADAQGNRNSSFVAPSLNNTVPTALERTGDFSELLDANNTGGAGVVHLFQTGGTPTTTATSHVQTSNPSNYYLRCGAQVNVICPGQISKTALAVLNLFPLPNQGAAHLAYQNYTVPATSKTDNTTQYDARLDYNFSSKDQMFARYSYSNEPTTFTPPFGVLDGGGFGSTGQNSNYGKSAVFSETHFFSPTLSNEFRVGFNYLHASYLQAGAAGTIAQQLGFGGLPVGPTLGGLPNISFGRYAHGVGVPNYLPSDEKQNVLQIIDNVSKVLGRHSLKAGMNFQHVRFYGLQPPNGKGTQSFSGTFTSDPSQSATPGVSTGAGLADFLLDSMSSSNLSSVLPFTDLRWYYSAFIQDDIRVSPRLTINAGLRWEYTQPIRERNDNQANFYATSLSGMNTGAGVYLVPSSRRNYPLSPTFLSYLATDHISLQYTDNHYLVTPKPINFAPRVGLNYKLSDKSVLRLGYGLFYGGLENIGLGLNLANNAPFFVNDSFIPTPNVCQNVLGTVTCPTNGQTLEGGFGAAATDPVALANAAGVGTVYAQDQNAKSSYTEAYNASLQQSVTNTLSYTISYQGNQSKHLRASYNQNQYAGYVPSGLSGQNFTPFHDFGITNVFTQGIARYDSLQAKVEKRYGAGLNFLAGYTWAKCLDDSFGPIGQSSQGGYRNVNLLGARYDYGTCTQDVRNRVTISGQYELPFGKGKRWAKSNALENAIVGGWKVSTVWQAQSGNPVFVTSSNQGSSYPYRLANPFATNLTQNPVTQPNFLCATKTRTIQQWFNPCAFYNPPLVVAGATNSATNQINVNEAGILPSGPRGRDPIVGPGLQRLDMSLFKSFALPFRESSLQVRVDAFNIENHPAFSNPGTSLSGGSMASTNQAITSTRFAGAGLPSARVLQVSARLLF